MQQMKFSFEGREDTDLEPTVEDFVEAYRRTGSRPLRGATFVEGDPDPTQNKPSCGCPVQVLATAAGADIDPVHVRLLTPHIEYLTTAYGISEVFLSGVITGVDTMGEINQDSSPELLRGVAVGRELLGLLKFKTREEVDFYYYYNFPVPADFWD